MHAIDVGGASALGGEGDPVAPGRPCGIVVQRAALGERMFGRAIGVGDVKDRFGRAAEVDDAVSCRARVCGCQGDTCDEKQERRTRQGVPQRLNLRGMVRAKRVSREVSFFSIFAGESETAIALAPETNPGRQQRLDSLWR